MAAALRRREPQQLALGRAIVARSRAAGERLQHGRWQVGQPLPYGLRRLGDSALEAPGGQPG